MDAHELEWFQKDRNETDVNRIQNGMNPNDRSPIFLRFKFPQNKFRLPLVDLSTQPTRKFCGFAKYLFAAFKHFSIGDCLLYSAWSQLGSLGGKSNEFS